MRRKVVRMLVFVGREWVGFAIVGATDDCETNPVSGTDWKRPIW